MEPIPQCAICFATWDAKRFVVYACGGLVCKSCCLLGLRKCPNCQDILHHRHHELSGAVATREKDFIGSKMIECDCAKILKAGELHDHLASACSEHIVKCRICDQEFYRHEQSEHEQTKCVFREIKCEVYPAIVQARLMQKHLDEQCPNTMISCTYECDSWFLRHESGQHFQVCDLFPVQCAKCLQIVTRRDYFEHATTKCVHRDVICFVCKEVVECSKLARHQISECPETIIGCSCKSHFPRRERQEHDKTCEFALVYCSHELCNHWEFRKNVARHQCDFEVIACEWCSQSLMRKHMLNHIRQCKQKPIRCCSCRKRVPLDKLAHHAAAECAKRNQWSLVTPRLKSGMVVDLQTEFFEFTWARYTIVGDEDAEHLFYAVRASDEQVKLETLHRISDVWAVRVVYS